MNNPEFEIATQFALHTSHPVFLTGKAGTGKTTLLKHVAEKTTKNFVIVAPTGVAAINAGGVTIHSMFHLPTTSFIPSYDYVNMNLVTNRSMLLSHLKFRAEKRKVIEEMELLIVDEVSMVRCDILDAIDFTLQTVRRNKKPFGGVQVMLIGDMHQLPPVVKDDEWAILQAYYSSPYFFDSKVWRQLDAVQIELQKIYRQADEVFLNILNNIRNKKMEEDDYAQLEKRYNPGFKPTEKGYILLSTHNRKADSINEAELNRLQGKRHSFEAETDGDFPENMYPCAKTLFLKEGAQVMFIKNDVEEGQYFNGKLAAVKKIHDGDITVTFNDSQQEFTLRHETWENITYSIGEGSNRIEKKILGTFSQYPLRLAWAITIHKSQGLTFDKVIIDAGASFASGQVYVALSRCRTLEGIILHSLIRQDVLYNDEKITAFSQTHHASAQLEQALADARKRYANEQLIRLFTFDKLSYGILEWKELLQLKDIPDKQKVAELCQSILISNEEIIATSEKFRLQLQRLLDDFDKDAGSIIQLRERCSKAIEYFAGEIFNKLVSPVHGHIQSLAYKSKVKKYLQQVQLLRENFWYKIDQLYESSFLDEKLFSGEIRFSRTKLKTTESAATSARPEKGATYKDSLNLHRQKKTVEEIAEIRGLTVSTIQSHFAKLIKDGALNIFEVMQKEKVLELEKYLLNAKEDNLGAIKAIVGDAFDYSEIRMVTNYLNRK